MPRSRSLANVLYLRANRRTLLAAAGGVVTAGTSSRLSAQGATHRCAGHRRGASAISSGPIARQDGSEGIPDGASLGDEDILHMDWFVEGVEGSASG